jgi:ubiquinone/menaquinone biosynthesis C-methylase UbiE
MKYAEPSVAVALADKTVPSPRPFFPPGIFGRKPNSDAPDYLDTYYWWAYVEPLAIKFWEREWLVNLILFGNYKVLGKAALDALDDSLGGKTLKVSCCYGQLTPRLSEKIAAKGGTLDVVDIMPGQLENLSRKLSPDAPVQFCQMDSRKLGFADAQFDNVLLFFLLHEQPPESREKSLKEALRVLKPGGRLVIVDYGRPVRWHPFRFLVLPLLGWLEPFAIALWRRELTELLAQPLNGCSMRQTPYFGGLYQCISVSKP